MNRNLVLIGRSGNGKSATGNTILGRKAFDSKAGANGVTLECQLETSELENGLTINVIDTPGFFDLSSQSDFTGDEVITCVDMVMDGIHAFLLVFSVRNRFTKEEEAVIGHLRALFGEKVLRYTIVVFTGGDDLEADESTLELYLGSGCPAPLKRIMLETKNGCALFNNKCKDKNDNATQVQTLLSIVDGAMERNKGRPFMDELIDLQARALKLRGKAAKKAKYAKQLDELTKNVMQEVESRLQVTIVMLEKQLEEAHNKSEADNQTVEDLKRRLEETEEMIRQYKTEKYQTGGGCSIL